MQTTDITATLVSLNQAALKNLFREIIKESFFEAIKKSINIDMQNSMTPIKSGYLVSIEIGKQKVFLLFDTSLLRTICKHFLSEDDPTQAMLEDMSKKLANLTAEHAKVIAQKQNKNFDISTPTFLGIETIENYDYGMHFRLRDKGRCSIYFCFYM